MDVLSLHPFTLFPIEVQGKITCWVFPILDVLAIQLILQIFKLKYYFIFFIVKKGEMFRLVLLFIITSCSNTPSFDPPPSFSKYLISLILPKTCPVPKLYFLKFTNRIWWNYAGHKNIICKSENSEWIVNKYKSFNSV